MPDTQVSVTRLALRALTELRPTLDRLEAAIVDRARLEDVSWEAIAADLRVTKQSAHRRHASHDPLAAGRRRQELPAEAARLVEGLDDKDGSLARLLADEIEFRRSKPARE